MDENLCLFHNYNGLPIYPNITKYLSDLPNSNIILITYMIGTNYISIAND